MKIIDYNNISGVPHWPSGRGAQGKKHAIKRTPPPAPPPIIRSLRIHDGMKQAHIYKQIRVDVCPLGGDFKGSKFGNVTNSIWPFNTSKVKKTTLLYYSSYIGRQISKYARTFCVVIDCIFGCCLPGCTILDRMVSQPFVGDF